ncbi:uncharacterized protein MELLADRAFT_95997 [Melampsora larici-populina 98AG31]|uniref:Uncharacterized protein n=1 Tax=Melampsora larici-populina (strain 98AG31 / pathotype 3-4-7) TaxID=747676 RepID=F4RE18_MELLP|nr:uncharacterized protein MELLADRAFT_95997 [Melampsora larici-populina 98AG31]EGG09506.1 hypothetical protein MELLADRAFT_95997 [Melampsora larici-populina 98AG31]
MGHTLSSPLAAPVEHTAEGENDLSTVHHTPEAIPFDHSHLENLATVPPSSPFTIISTSDCSLSSLDPLPSSPLRKISLRLESIRLHRSPSITTMSAMSENSEIVVNNFDNDNVTHAVTSTNKNPEDEITNFKEGMTTIVWTHTMRTERNDIWTIRRYYCLGLLTCSEPGCQLAGLPPTGHKGIEKHLAKFPNCTVSRCPGVVNHLECHARCRVDKDTIEKWYLLRHQGQHTHRWPDPKKADPLAKEKLEAAVLADPKLGPLGMKVGRARVGTAPIPSITDVHSSFAHTDRLGYLRREILAKHGLMDDKNDKHGGDRWYTQIRHWSKKGMKIVSVTMDDNNHFTFQTKWMAEMLVLQQEDGEAYSGGLLSDVTYKFFLNGYLLTTSMYNEKLQRWIPILLTWLGGLSTLHYKAHFVTLLKQIQKTELSDREKRRLVEQVVDFSVAQKNGFIDAYLEVFNIHDRKIPFSKLHGCEQHYQQAVTHISKNHKIVKVNMVGTWKKLCRELLLPDEPGRPNLEQRFKDLRRLFPLAKKWIDWWYAADVQAMLFPARKRIPEDDPPLPDEESDDEDDGKPRRRSDLPKTTNAQESLHRVYYMLCDGKCGIISGMIQLFAFVSSLQRDYESRLKGISVTYGSSNQNWQDVVTSLGMAKPTKHRYIANDGRAPDTTQELLDYADEHSGKVVKKKGPGRPQGSQNINRSALTTYKSYTSGSTIGTLNRCWQTATLESLYALWGPLWSDHTNVNGSSLPTIVIRHFTGRCDAEVNQGKHLGGLLKQGQNIIHKVIQALKPESYISDECCLADGFMDMMVDHPSTRPLFAINVTKTLICHCNHTHNRETTKYLGCFRIFPSMFRETALAYGQLDVMLQDFLSNGVITEPGLVCRQCHPKKRQGGDEGDLTMLEQRMKIEHTLLPLHLYFLLDNVMALDSKERGRYMGDTNWPARLVIGKAQYQMVTRGFWGGNHYWCQVVRSVEGVLGVWHYDELKNGGFAQLISRDVDSISGCIANTSWTCYTRVPFESEANKVKKALLDLMKRFPDQHLSMPFSMPTSTIPFGGGLPSLADEGLLSTTIIPDEVSLPVVTHGKADEEEICENNDQDLHYEHDDDEELLHNNDDILYANEDHRDEDVVMGTSEADVEVNEDALSHQASEELIPPVNPVNLKIKLAIPKSKERSPPVASTPARPRL